MQEVLRYPTQKQPQIPAVAEVHDRDRRHALEQGKPGGLTALALVVDGCGREREFLRRDARMVGGNSVNVSAQSATHAKLMTAHA